MWRVFYVIAAFLMGCATVKLCRSSVRLYRSIMADRRAREKRMEERHVWRAHVAIVHTEKGRSLVLPTEEYDALMQRLTEKRAMIIPTDDDLGIVMFGRNVYPEGLAPAQIGEHLF